MIETWLQYTCDSCGMTEYTDGPGYTKTRLKTELKESGWKNYRDLDYCPKCVQKGHAKSRKSDMNEPDV